MRKRVGDPVSAGETLCVIHAGTNTDIEPAKALILSSITIAETKPEKRTLIHAVVE
jgi:Thymidine phosphorylase